MTLSRFVLFVVAIALTVEKGDAQVSMSEFIASAYDDFEVKTFQDQVSYLNRKPYRISPLRETEVRVQNREMLQTHWQYGLRLSPSNPWEMKANSRYYQNVRSSLELEGEMALKDALVSRYYTIIEYLYYQQLRTLNVEGQETLNKQLDILEQQSGSRYFDADEYAELKVDQLNYTVQYEEYSYEVANQMHRIVRMYPKAHRRDIAWDPGSVISVERIKTVVDSLIQSSFRSALIAYQQQKINVAKSHYELEKHNFNLGFAQANYDFRRYHQDRNPVSISFGLALPITNPNKGDMARRKLNIIDAEYDLKETESENETDKLILQDRLLGLIDRYITLKLKITELEENNFAQTLSQIKGGDPLMFVQYNERIRKLDTLLARIRRNILNTYVEYLAFTDRIQQEPMINYLSPGLNALGGSR
jgi:hypothetical protein